MLKRIIKSLALMVPAIQRIVNERESLRKEKKVMAEKLFNISEEIGNIISNTPNSSPCSTISDRVNVLIPTAHGLMLVNRHETNFKFGVSKQLLESGGFDLHEIALLRMIMKELGPDATYFDIGANIGVHTIEFARQGKSVISFEPQRYIFQMLCANIALNSLFNVHAIWGAVGESESVIDIPFVDYKQPGSYGNLELRQVTNEYMGQIDRSINEKVQLYAIDKMDLPPPDFIKIDVEGMESNVIEGAKETLKKQKPIVMVEYIKSDRNILSRNLQTLGYDIYEVLPLNWICIHKEQYRFKFKNLLPFLEGTP